MRSDMFLVTPMNQKVFLEPGEEYHGKIQVVNPAASSGVFRYRVEVAPYGIVGEDYDASFTVDSQWTKMVEWITLENDNGELEPNGKQNVNFTIRVPEDAPVGAQTAALVVRQDEDGNDTKGMNVDNVLEMASILYAQVAGIEEHDGKILGMEIPGFSTTPDVKIKVTLDNHGNVFEEAESVVKVKNVLDGQVILPTEEASGKYTEIVMPDTTREVERKIDDLPMLGIVSIEHTVKYNGEEMALQQVLVICPIWFMIMVTISLTMIVTTIVLLVRRHRRNKIELV